MDELQLTVVEVLHVVARHGFARRAHQHAEGLERVGARRELGCAAAFAALANGAVAAVAAVLHIQRAAALDLVIAGLGLALTKLPPLVLIVAAGIIGAFVPW